MGCYNGQLRYFTADGMLAPTPEEDALQAQQRAEGAQQQAQEAQQRAERLAERLRSLGVEPDGK